MIPIGAVELLAEDRVLLLVAAVTGQRRVQGKEGRVVCHCVHDLARVELHVLDHFGGGRKVIRVLAAEWIQSLRARLLGHSLVQFWRRRAPGLDGASQPHRLGELLRGGQGPGGRGCVVLPRTGLIELLLHFVRVDRVVPELIL